MIRSSTSHRTAPRAAFSPEKLEGRVLLSAGVSTDNQTGVLGVGDFNGDGTDDQVLFARTLRARQRVANAGALDRRHSSFLLIDGADGSLLGDGIPAGSGGRATPLVAVADFNRDGHQDLAIANAGRSGGNLRVLLGNGDGTFSGGRAVRAPANITSLSAADVNADGNVDLVVTSAVSSAQSRRAAGSGSTIAPDFRFELDTAARLLVPPVTGGGVGAEAGGATGSFGSERPAVAGLDTTALIGLDNDGTAGVVVSVGGGVEGVVAGTFNPRPGVSGEAGGSIAASGTGFGETAVSENGNNTAGATRRVTVLLGNGDGTFRAATTAGRRSR